MMNFSDIFKKSFLEGFSGAKLSTADILVALLVTTLLGIYIFFVYRQMTKKTFYSKSFNISLVAMATITAAVILTIQSNIVISLGMVGALSIVRFRTAIKDPLDLIFLFWALSVGIICGAGMAQIAVLLSLLVTICIFILDLLPMNKAPMILVVNAQNFGQAEEIYAAIQSYSNHYKIKSRNLTEHSFDLIAEVRTQDPQGLLQALIAMAGVSNASLLDHDGEVTF